MYICTLVRVCLLITHVCVHTECYEICVCVCVYCNVCVCVYCIMRTCVYLYEVYTSFVSGFTLVHVCLYVCYHTCVCLITCGCVYTGC